MRPSFVHIPIPVGNPQGRDALVKQHLPSMVDVSVQDVHTFCSLLNVGPSTRSIYSLHDDYQACVNKVVVSRRVKNQHNESSQTLNRYDAWDDLRNAKIRLQTMLELAKVVNGGEILSEEEMLHTTPSPTCDIDDSDHGSRITDLNKTIESELKTLNKQMTVLSKLRKHSDKYQYKKKPQYIVGVDTVDFNDMPSLGSNVPHHPRL